MSTETLDLRLKAFRLSAFLSHTRASTPTPTSQMSCIAEDPAKKTRHRTHPAGLQDDVRRPPLA